MMHADWDDLNPLLERFDIDELVAWGLQMRSRARQYEAEGASSQEAAADPGPGPATTTSASSASSSGAPPGLGAAQAQQETPQVAAKKQGAPPAKSPTTGPPPVMGKPPQMSQAAKAFVKADPPPLKADPAAEQEGQRSRQCRGFATAQASRGPEAGLGESYADPGRVYVRRDSSTADSRGCDDAAMTSAPKAVVPSQVAVVELDNPPLPPPAPPTGTSSPPSKPMPQVPKAASTPPASTTSSQAAQGTAPATTTLSHWVRQVRSPRLSMPRSDYQHPGRRQTWTQAPLFAMSLLLLLMYRVFAIFAAPVRG